MFDRRLTKRRQKELAEELRKGNAVGVDNWTRKLSHAQLADQADYLDLLAEGRFAVMSLRRGFVGIDMEPPDKGPDLKAELDKFTLFRLSSGVGSGRLGSCSIIIFAAGPPNSNLVAFTSIVLISLLKRKIKKATSTIRNIGHSDAIDLIISTACIPKRRNKFSYYNRSSQQISKNPLNSSCLSAYASS